ncbi:MAG: class II aldolase/adducin family protein [Lachnospiraceae bacterium]
MEDKKIHAKLKALHGALLEAVPQQQGIHILSIRTTETEYAMVEAPTEAESIGEDCIRKGTIQDSNEVLASIYRKNPQVNTIIYVASKYAVRASQTLKVLPAALDDMAQIVGRTARIAKVYEKAAIEKSLKKRNACLVKGTGMFVTGRTEKEAVTTAILLEKACGTHLLAQQIGGVKKVPFLAGIIMHIIYQKKYSVINLAEEAKREETL